jgi:type I restriction enzyme S subunit
MEMIPFPLPLEEQKAIITVVETLFKVEQLEPINYWAYYSKKKSLLLSALNQLTTNNIKQEWAFTRTFS